MRVAGTIFELHYGSRRLFQNSHRVKIRKLASPRLGVKPVAPQLSDVLLPCTIQLPGTVHVPLPSPQLVKYLPEAVHEAQTTIQSWEV